MKWKPLTTGPKSIVNALNQLGELVTRGTVVEGVGVRASEGPGGTLVEARGNGVGGGGSICPLSQLSGTDTEGVFTINAGEVNAAGAHVEVGGPDGDTLTAGPGVFAWVECEIVAEVLENTLTGSWSVDPTSIVLGYGLSPTDHDWTPEAATGKAYALLGGWDAEEVWTAYGCGAVSFLFCSSNTQSGSARFYRG